MSTNTGKKGSSSKQVHWGLTRIFHAAAAFPILILGFSMIVRFTKNMTSIEFSLNLYAKIIERFDCLFLLLVNFFTSCFF